MTRKLLTTTLLMVLGLAMAVPGLTDPQDVCEFENVAVFAKNSVDIGNGAKVNGGHVVANDVGASTSLGVKVSVTGDVYGDFLSLGSNVAIDGTAFCNNLGSCDEFTPPVFNTLPAFSPADPGTEDVILAPGEALALPLRFCSESTQIACSEGGNECPVDETCDALRRYGDIVGGLESTVIFEPGVYDLRSISIEKKGDLLFQGPTEFRVAGDIDLGIESDIKSETGLSVPASEIVFYVGGNAYLGPKSNVNANFYVPDGTLELPSNVIAYGAFIGQDVIVGSKTQIHLVTAFANLPPVADPQTVTTSGDSTIVITLTGSDPEGFDVFFGTVSDPTHGTLTDPEPIIPDEIPVLDREGNPTGEIIQPPVTSATVVYTPTGCTTDEGDVTCPADSFVFDVSDSCSAVAEAEVDINPNDPTPTPTPVDQVVANDVATETTTGTTVTITLDAEAPGFCSTTDTQVCQDFENSLDCPAAETCDPDPLTFAITSLPFGGALTDSGNNAIESVVTTLPDSTVNYTPDAGFVSGICSVSADDLCEVNDDCPLGETCIQPDSFDYSATGVLGGTDSATVTVRVFEQVELATDQSVTTPKNTPTIVTLQGNSGGSGIPTSAPLQQTQAPLPAAPGAPLPGATIAGNVGDADGDGFGDGRDNLPGSAPLFISAAVDRNFSSGSSSDEATFQATLAGGYAEYDFETSSGFPSSGGVIGLVDGIDFQATTFVYGPPPPPSGTQGMTGLENTFSLGKVDFTGLEVRPNAFGFFALDLTQGEVVRVTAYYAGGWSTFDVALGPNDPNHTPIYFGHYDTSKVLDSLSIRGTDGTGIDRAWLIDDLTVGRRSTVSGVTRIQIEWDISSLDIGASEEIESATVRLSTNKGSNDSLDTFFYVVTEDRDGVLDVSDFESTATQLPGVVMPVPDVAVGTDGTFSFNVTNALKNAFDQGFDYFSIQGRVEEDLAGQGSLRGLQIRSTATGNLTAGTEPRLEVVTEQPDPGIVLRVLSLPVDEAGAPTGTLTDLAGFPVAVNQTFTTTTDLLFTPAYNFSGTASFDYSATQASLVDAATVAILVSVFDPCVLVGRDPGCAPGGGNFAPPQTSQAEENETSPGDDASLRASNHNLRVVVEGEGTGSVASSRIETDLGSRLGVVCDKGPCGNSFANGAEVTLYARPIGDDSEFIRWGGDCAGTEPITTIRLWGKHLCTAEFGKK